jgi:hypothetical protein
MKQPNDDTTADDGGAAAASNGELTRSTWPARDGGQAGDVTAAEPAGIDIDRVASLILTIGITAAAIAAVVVMARAIKTPIVVRHI